MSAIHDRGGVALNRPVFVFSGHGGQWPGMGIELWDGFPTLATAMEDCAAAFCPSLGSVARRCVAQVWPRDFGAFGPACSAQWQGVFWFFLGPCRRRALVQ
jgi:hypothetical protein